MVSEGLRAGEFKPTQEEIDAAMVSGGQEAVDALLAKYANATDALREDQSDKALEEAGIFIEKNIGEPIDPSKEKFD